MNLFKILFQVNAKQEKESNKNLLAKTNLVDVMPVNEAEEREEEPQKIDKLVLAVRAVAWYINPLLYLLFSLAYFTFGPLY